MERARARMAKARARARKARVRVPSLTVGTSVVVKGLLRGN